MNIDDEIMQEFLVEAGELFDQLNDQFVELDNSRQDEDLINAIFRAYHTIKGGAGFMKLTPMVEVCHRAEDVIGQIRQNEREVTDDMIDVMFQVLDALEIMFATVRDGEALQDAEVSLIRQLDQLLATKAQSATDNEVLKKPEEHTQAAVNEEGSSLNNTTESAMDDEFEAMLAGSAPASSDLITDDEFEAALDKIHGKGKHSTAGESTDSSSIVAQRDLPDLITDDEFDAALDKIHGKGKHGASDVNVTTTTAVTAASSDLISDDEFEAALDKLHGKGKGPKVSTETGSVETATVAENNAIAEQQESNAVATSAKEKPVKLPVKDALKKDKAQLESTVRVDTSRLDDIMNLVGELVLVRNRLTTLKHDIKEENIQDAISTLELVTSELQGSVMKTRMQPIKKVFSRFPRVIRDLARKLDKDINLELNGEETDLDKSLVEALADPLIHLVRNAADHGIESPQERFEAGKSRQGKVTLSAKQEGDQVLLTVKDDGKGMDHTVLRRKAVEKGMMSEDAANSMTNKEVYNLIFAAGFSTKTEISDVSGRGVGMDVVKTRINELSGNVEIDSVHGEGSVISIYLPLTLAILPTLMVKLDQYQFALPLSNVQEAFNMEPEHINVIDGQQVIRVRDKPLPLFFLGSWLVDGCHLDGAKPTQKVIVVQMGNQRFCLVVDHIAGQEEVVIKPLGTMLTNTQGFSGATITSDGGIALIIDVPSLINNYAANSAIY